MVEYLVDNVYLALSDATRRQMIEFLQQGPSRVTTIAKQFPQSLNAISKHLKCLEKAGIVHRSVLGREHWCSINPEPLAVANRWIAEQEVFWQRKLDRLESFLKIEIELKAETSPTLSHSHYQKSPTSKAGIK
jgi:DNA-binding transcriptional ArsR family regulator